MQAVKRQLEFLLTRTPRRYAGLLALRSSYDLDKRLFLELLRPRDVVFDVGANVGHYTLLFSHLVGAQGKVRAFEPLPATCTRLRAAIASYGRFDNVRVEPLALADAAGDAMLYLPGEDHGQAALVPHHAGSWRLGVVTPFACRRVTLDGYLETHSVERLDLIKCDVEGAEFLVLRGAARALARHCPLLHVELSAAWSADFGYTPADLLDFLTERAYVARLLVKPGNADAAIEHALDGSEGSVNLLAWSPERHAGRIPAWVHQLPTPAEVVA